MILLPSLDGLGQPSPVTVAGAGSWLQVPVPLATIETTLGLVGLGQAVTLELGGEVGSLVLCYFALGQVPAITVPGIHGEILLNPLGAVPLAPTSISGLGIGVVQVTVPQVPSLVGNTFLAQAFAAGPSGDVSFSSPTFIGIR